MTVEITVRDVVDPVQIEGDFAGFIADLNIAAASGKQFVICKELGGGPVAFETRNITIMRDAEDDSSFIGR